MPALAPLAVHAEACLREVHHEEVPFEDLAWQRALDRVSQADLPVARSHSYHLH